MKWLTESSNIIFTITEMPKEWRWMHNKMVPLYKNKGDIHSYDNYRGIKLLSHTKKV